jgi:ribosomal protein S20
MSVTGVSSSSTTAQMYQSSNANPFKQDFNDLATALQNGNLQAAQDAFTKIQELHQQKEAKKSNNGNSNQNGSNPIKTDMTALQQALQSGDLKASQDAFTKLQEDMKSAQKNGHHHNASASAATSTTSPATGLNITA